MSTNIGSPKERRALTPAEYHASTVFQARMEALNRMELSRLELEEPECECQQTDVDLFDSHGCELHNPNSKWNVALRQVSMMDRYEVYTTEPVEVQECPF